MAEEKLLHRREFGLTRNHKAAVATNIMEAIAQFRGGDAAGDGSASTRMKIVGRKEDLNQVLEAIRDGRGGACRRATAAATSLEQRLNFMRRRHILRASSQVKCRSWGSWAPFLQSIPEEY